MAVCQADRHNPPFTILLTLFVFVFQLLEADGVNQTCPHQQYIDVQTGRCTVKIGFVPQDVFAYPVLDGRQDYFHAKTSTEAKNIMDSYMQLYPPGHVFSGDSVKGCKSVAVPCPALGIDMELISRVFGSILDWDFVLVPYYTYPSALYAARMGNVDMSWAAMSITGKREACVDCPEAPFAHNATSEYICCLDFSYHYWEGGLTLVLEPQETTSFYEALFTIRMLNVFCFFVLLLMVAGHCIWIAETCTKEGRVCFPRTYTTGVFQGIYWAVTTATTVGYGDTRPTSVLGKLFAMGWMVIGIVLSGTVSGYLASAITVQDLAIVELTSLDKLSGKTLCYVAGYSEAWLQDQGGGFRSELAPSINECFQWLENGRVDAVLFDKPWLDRYSDIGRFGEKFVVSETLLNKADYGVAFPESSLLTHRISAALLTLVKDTGLMQQFSDRWIGETDGELSSDEKIHWPPVIIAMVLVAWQTLVGTASWLGCKIKKRDSVGRRSSKLWQTAAWNHLDSMLTATIDEIRSSGAELKQTHQDLIKRTDTMMDAMKSHADCMEVMQKEVTSIQQMLPLPTPPRADPAKSGSDQMLPLLSRQLVDV